MLNICTMLYIRAFFKSLFFGTREYSFQASPVLHLVLRNTVPEGSPWPTFRSGHFSQSILGEMMGIQIET